MDASTIEGLIGAAAAIIFFGSCYVVTKGTPLDSTGILFSWLMSTGILTVGFVTVAFQKASLVFTGWGILAGAIWCCGNLMTVPIIKCIGLGVGFLIWGGSCLIFSYVTGRMGLFGLDMETNDSISKEVMSITGIVLGVISLVITIFIKSSNGQDTPKKNAQVESSSSPKDTKTVVIEMNGQNDTSSSSIPVHHDHSSEVQHDTHNDQNHHHHDDHDDHSPTTSLTNPSQSKTHHEEASNKKPSSIMYVKDEARHIKRHIVTAMHKVKTIADKMESNPTLRRGLGITLGLIAGLAYAVNLIPFKLWLKDKRTQGVEPGAVDFFFSYTAGIFLTSTFVMLVHVILRKNHPMLPQTLVLPSFLCGVLWSCASIGQQMATNYLGIAIGFGLTSVGPSIVSSFWNAFVFREIRGWRNLTILGLSIVFAIAGVVLLALSKV